MARPIKYDGVVYKRKGTKFWWMRFRDHDGARQSESTHTDDWEEAQKRLRTRMKDRDENVLDIVRRGETLTFGEWVEFFLENYSTPPFSAPKTHQANLRAVKHLKRAFANRRLVDVTADAIEQYLRYRLSQRVKFKTSLGYVEREKVKSTTVHQEFRVLRRMLNVAVCKKLLTSNSCS